MNFLTCKSIEKFVDARYEKGKPIPDGQVLFCYPEDVKYLFAEIEQTGRRIILVSSGSDYGVCYQVEHPVNADINKATYAIDYEGIAKENKYVRLELATADYNECVFGDRFSVKMDRYTVNTFPLIPHNIVQWFCANANITESQVRFLPFGINYEGDGYEVIKKYRANDKKTSKIYVNFRVNSVGRLLLDDVLKQINHPLIRFVAENKKIDDYYQEMASYEYSLCPASNGIDSFRVWETYILGSIPIIELSRWAKNLFEQLNLPMVVVQNVQDIVRLDKLPNFHFPQYKEVECKLTEEYWQQEIESARKLL